MPLPPPPPAAFSITGKPIFAAKVFASSTFAKGAVVPGTTGTPAFIMFARAVVFSPIASIALAGGPMKVTPAFSHARTNFAFSERKPYPG